MTKPVPEVTQTKQRFVIPLYFRVDPISGVPIPCDEHDSDYRFHITIEYPTYEEELEIRRKAHVQDEAGVRLDYDIFTELRVRRCLVKWDLHERLAGFTDKLLRMHNQLTDESLELWKKLPPLLRKTISNTINEYLGI